ncbi:MAG: hypothetical protein QGH73_04520 [Rhodospirillales bacterium]|jgi:hypothetical protein|nr:hypothetical protein [Rhodospirillaceae bacterium]MDP6427152.1 hypothetical protein [Rhodospirillales bacterium]MDP6646668.1 hypothetical protein [Rhodospirillales bacterium]MDP6840921.1 hypothetical protein [Rhodospirillales bacterium]|tara:strand:- start:998 stop:1183 length:186 start_codon:yes stop_codon:yes gene_type:complete
MRFAVKYHEVTGEWLVFDVGDGFELVGMHQNEDEAVYHAMKLEERSRRRAQWSSEPVPQAA